MKLAVEANGVIALRTITLMQGGKSARREAELMVSEKIHAAVEAAASLMTGASGNQIVHRYRQHVVRNAKQEFAKLAVPVFRHFPRELMF